LNKDEEDKAKGDDIAAVSYRAEGRVLFHDYRLKKPIADFIRFVPKLQNDALTRYCSDKQWFLRDAKSTQTYTYYSAASERLISFSIGPRDCGQW